MTKRQKKEARRAAEEQRQIEAAKSKAEQKAYNEANKELIAAKKKLYWQANKERITEQRKDYYEDYREINRERINAKSKAYYQANKERINAKAKEARAAKKAATAQTQSTNEQGGL